MQQKSISFRLQDRLPFTDWTKYSSTNRKISKVYIVCAIKCIKNRFNGLLVSVPFRLGQGVKCKWRKNYCKRHNKNFGEENLFVNYYFSTCKYWVCTLLKVFVFITLWLFEDSQLFCVCSFSPSLFHSRQGRWICWFGSIVLCFVFRWAKNEEEEKRERENINGNRISCTHYLIHWCMFVDVEFHSKGETSMVLSSCLRFRFWTGEKWLDTLDNHEQVKCISFLNITYYFF